MSDEDRFLSSNTNDGKRPLAITIAMFTHQQSQAHDKLLSSHDRDLNYIQYIWQETWLAMSIKFAGHFLQKSH